jgi:recombination DNA repair RAD52 pathway protein
MDEKEMRDINNKFEQIIDEQSQQRLIMTLLGTRMDTMAASLDAHAKNMDARMDTMAASLDAHAKNMDARMTSFRTDLNEWQTELTGTLKVFMARQDQFVNTITAHLVRHNDRIERLEEKEEG